jgi:DNA-binding MarR family transcriptional regulator
MIDRLEKAGFVKRQSDPIGRRKVIIIFIPQKHEKEKRYYAAMAKDVYDLFAGYNNAKLKSLKRHSDALAAIFQQYVEKIIHQ